MLRNGKYDNLVTTDISYLHYRSVCNTDYLASFTRYNCTIYSCNFLALHGMALDKGN